MTEFLTVKIIITFMKLKRICGTVIILSLIAVITAEVHFWDTASHERRFQDYIKNFSAKGCIFVACRLRRIPTLRL